MTFGVFGKYLMPWTKLPWGQRKMRPDNLVMELNGCRVTQPNFDHLLDLTTSTHFIPSEFDPWYKMYAGDQSIVSGRNWAGLL